MEDADETYVDVSVSRGEPPPTPPPAPSTSKGKKPPKEKKAKEPKEPKELIVPDGLSLEHRDPQGIHIEDDSDLKVAFPDIFAEPEGLHSDDGVWVCAYKTYNGSRHWCYTICSFICAVPAACIWGITFACLAFCHIWYVVPFLKAFLIELKCIGRVFALCIQTFCDPIYSSIALMFSKIRVVFIRSSGEHEYP